MLLKEELDSKDKSEIKKMIKELVKAEALKANKKKK